MLNNKEFYDLLNHNNINYFTGVPDSLLKNFLSYIQDNTPVNKHIISSSEGSAAALAAGYYLATKSIPLIYMQNSGLGNAINPLVSLMDKEVYSIPALLLIGWRGEPEKKDEPQHIKQGRITKELLNTLEIPFKILPDNTADAKQAVHEAIDYMNKNSAPYALLVPSDTFEPYKIKFSKSTSYDMNREEAIKVIIDNIPADSIVVSTTGKTSRELFEYRESKGQGHDNDFLTVGSMGHASQIALGIAREKPDKTVFCLDGDGAFLMHMGSLTVVGQQKTYNFKHIVLNNGAHCSVGGQPTCGFDIEMTTIAKASGYNYCNMVEQSAKLQQSIKDLIVNNGPALLEIRVNKGARENLGRPTSSPSENKSLFTKKLED